MVCDAEAVPGMGEVVGEREIVLVVEAHEEKEALPERLRLGVTVLVAVTRAEGLEVEELEPITPVHLPRTTAP